MDNLATKCISDLQTFAWNAVHKEISIQLWHAIAIKIWDEIEEKVSDATSIEIWWEMRDG